MSSMENDKSSTQSTFLEVTINSQKLIQQLAQFHLQTKAQQRQIEEIKQTMAIMRKSLLSEIEFNREETLLEMEKHKKIITEEMRHNKLYLTEIDQEVEKKNAILQRKIGDKTYEIQLLSEKQRKNQQCTQQLEEKMIRLNQQNNLELNQTRKRIEELLEAHDESNQKFERQVEMVIVKVQSLLSEHANGIKVSIPRQIAFERKITTKMATNLAKFSSQLQNIDKRMKQNQNPILNNVISPTHHPEQKSSLSIDLQEEETPKIDMKKKKKTFSRKDIEDAITKRIFHDFEETIGFKINEILVELSKHKNKSVVLDEKINIQGRKLEKEHMAVGELKNKLHRMEERKSDQQLIESLRIQMKKNLYQLGEEIEKKLMKQEFDKEKTKIFSKISILQENICEKAEKGEIKKALLFLQDKIKQIILLLANEQIQDKDGALKKIPVKCLSCDKGLQATKVSPRPTVKTSCEKGYRTMTSRLTKRSANGFPQLQHNESLK